MKKLNQSNPNILITVLFVLFLNPVSINAQTTLHRDSVTDFLTDYTGTLNVAAVPTSIDFGIIDIGKANPDLDFTHWGHVVLGPDDKFYYAIGDHNLSGTVVLKSYDPITKTDEVCIYSPDVPGLADGKWHGRPVINPSTGDMYLIGFYQGQVVKYNIYSKDVTNYGPVGGHGWEEHIWDYQRNRLYGVGSDGEILVYDTENNSVIYSDIPFPDFYTDNRARMVDMETGMFYATGDFGQLYMYNPATKVFTKLKSKLPSDLRANTNTKEADGSFWVMDRGGDMYKFFPDKDSLVSKGLNGETGEYVTFIERSPHGNYLYYIAAHSDGHLIQYNTNTDEKKVIAQLLPFYSTRYQYLLDGSFGGALSRNGNSIFIVCNGFSNEQRAALFHVHIPQAEKDLESSVKKNNVNISEISTYPNPFKSFTIVSFHIKKPGNVSLTIMDITGKTMHTLHNGYLQAGSHQLEWNINEAKRLSQGFYFCSLQLNYERVVKMLVVL